MVHLNEIESNSSKWTHYSTKGKINCGKIENNECDFSSGWLYRFQKRHGISAHVISCEKNKVNEQTVDEWKQEFRLIRQHYSDKDVFNIDETGVFYNLLPERTLDFKGKKCYGGTKSKERLTAVLCCNADGSEKLKLWIVGKSKYPRKAWCDDQQEQGSLDLQDGLVEEWQHYQQARAISTTLPFEDYINIDKELFTSGNLEVVPVIYLQAAIWNYLQAAIWK
ncbi:DDE superfamily endonuclease [Popillia japonica]|uniref:DDE superfamily endonuclease n=1 Tax=Popillia japonica TaxID=7064 RepID=A0AAW1JK31_POPJA